MSSDAPWHVRSSRTRDQTRVSCIGRQILYCWATGEAQRQLFSKSQVHHQSYALPSPTLAVANYSRGSPEDGVIQVLLSLGSRGPRPWGQGEGGEPTLFCRDRGGCREELCGEGDLAVICLDVGLIHSYSGEGNGTPLQYSCLENPMNGGAWQASVPGVAKSLTGLSDFTFTFVHWRRKWQPTPVFLPGESQGRGSLVGCCLWGRTELDTTEAT